MIARNEVGADVLRYDSDAPLAGATGDIEGMVLYAGQGVGLVRRLQPAADIVREIAEGAGRALDQTARLLRPGAGIEEPRRHPAP